MLSSIIPIESLKDDDCLVLQRAMYKKYLLFSVIKLIKN